LIPLAIIAALLISLAAVSSAAEPAAPAATQAPTPRPMLEPIPIAEVHRTTPVSFEAEILPILRKNCLACHKSGDPAGDLVLEAPDLIRAGGESGPALVPGHGAESRLLRLASHQLKPLMPPPDNKVGASALTSEQLGLLKIWIDQGAQGAAGTIAKVVPRTPLPAAATRPILALAVSPDDELLACSRGNALSIYDLRGPRRSAEPVDPGLAAGGWPGAAHEDLIRSLAFNHQGDLLASGGFRTVKIWKRPRGTFERDITVNAAARCLAVSPKGEWLAVGTQSGVIELHDLAGKSPTKILSKHDGAVTGVAFSPDAARLYSAGLDHTIRAWDVASGKAAGKLTTPIEIRALAILDGGQQLATGDADNVIRIWNTAVLLVDQASTTAPKPQPKELHGHSKPVTSLAVVPATTAIAAVPAIAARPATPTTPATDAIPGKPGIAAAGERLLSGGEDGSVRLWNPATGNQIMSFDHGAPVASVAAGLGGRRAMSVGANGAARLWNPDDGALVADIKQDPRAARAVAICDGTVNYAKASIEYRKEEMRDAQEQLKRETTALDEANKGKTTAEKAVADKTEPARKAVEARTAAEAKLPAAIAAFKAATDKRNAAQAAIEPAEKALKEAIAALEQATQAAAKDKANAALAAARTAAEKKLADARVARQAADTALQQANVAFRDQEVNHYKTKGAADEAADRARQPERELQEAKNTLQGAINFIATATIVMERAKLAVPAAEKAVAAAMAAEAAREAEQKKLIAAAVASAKPLAAVAFARDGRFVAIGGQVLGIRLYDAQRGTPVEILEREPAAAPASGAVNTVALAFGGDGRLFAAGADSKVSVWKTGAPWTLERMIGHLDDPAELVDRVLSLDFSPDGKLLATGGGLPARSAQLKIWNVADGKLVREIPAAHRDTIFGVKFSPDGQYLATASADRLMKVFRVADGSLVHAFEGHTSHVLGVAWQADGKLLATCGADHLVKLWDFATGAPRRTMRGDSYLLGEYKFEVNSIAFVGDTEHLVVSSGDHTVRIHRTSSDRDVRAYKEGASFMHAAAATSDGKLVIGGGQDGILHIWNGETGYPVPPFEPREPAINTKIAK
jgi:WD40 repeat protein